MFADLLILRLDVNGTYVPDSIVFLASWPACGYGKKVNDTSECMDDR